MFSVHTTPEKIENTTITCHFGFVFEKILEKGNHIVIIVTSSFLKSPVFQNVLFLHKNAKSTFSNSSGLKRVFEKLRFRDGLVWTVGLTVEIKLRFQIPPA